MDLCWTEFCDFSFFQHCILDSSTEVWVTQVIVLCTGLRITNRLMSGFYTLLCLPRSLPFTVVRCWLTHLYLSILSVSQSLTSAASWTPSPGCSQGTSDTQSSLFLPLSNCCDGQCVSIGHPGTQCGACRECQPSPLCQAREFCLFSYFSVSSAPQSLLMSSLSLTLVILELYYCFIFLLIVPVVTNVLKPWRGF